MQSWKVQLFSYLSSIWQYRWYGIAATWIICLAGWIGVGIIPDQYQSEAKVYIDTDTLLRPLLKGLAVSNDADQQVSVMLRTLITRPNIEQVIRLTDPRAAAMSPAALQDKIYRRSERCFAALARRQESVRRLLTQIAIPPMRRQ